MLKYKKINLTTFSLERLDGSATYCTTQDFHLNYWFRNGGAGIMSLYLFNSKELIDVCTT